MTPRPCEYTHGPHDAACERPAVWILGGVLGGPSVCDDCYKAMPAHYRVGAKPVPPEVPTVDAFTLADRQFCERIAAEFYAARAEVSGAAWASLAARIQSAMGGTFARFTSVDAQLVQSLHVATLKHAEADGAKFRSRMCSRLGVLVVQAARGQLAQLRGATV